MKQIPRKALSKFTATMAALCLVLALVPAMAFATTATTGTINFDSTTGTTLNVDSGETDNINSLLDDPTVDGDDWHYDFVIKSGSGISVNKHTGVVTASTVTADTSAVVTVYLMADTAPTGNSGKPCTGYTILDQEDVTVNVIAPETSEVIPYSYQGNSLQIQVTNPSTATVISGSNSSSIGWNNSFPAGTFSAGSPLSLTFVMSSGTGTYSVAGFNEVNEGNVTLQKTSGLLEDEDDDFALTLSFTGTRATTLTLTSTSNLTSGSYLLTFDGAFQAASTTKTLGCPITFSFTVA